MVVREEKWLPDCVLRSCPIPAALPYQDRHLWSCNPCHAVVYVVAADRHENNLRPLLPTSHVVLREDGGLMETASCQVFTLGDLLLLSCAWAVKTGLQLVSSKFDHPVTAVHEGSPMASFTFTKMVE